MNLKSVFTFKNLFGPTSLLGVAAGVLQVVAAGTPVGMAAGVVIALIGICARDQHADPPTTGASK